jgi:hypothetical protein
VVAGEYRSVEFEVANLAEFPLCALTLQIRQVGDWGDCSWDQINLDIDCDEAQDTRRAGGAGVAGAGRGGGIRVLISGLVDCSLPEVVVQGCACCRLLVCPLEPGYLTLAARVLNHEGEVLFQGLVFSVLAT